MSSGWTLPSSSRASPFNSEDCEWLELMSVRFTRDTGMRLYDVKYKGERIIYELGLQEAIAHYAGNDPHQSGTAYLGTFPRYYSARRHRRERLISQTRTTGSVPSASTRSPGTTSHLRDTACRPPGTRTSCPR